MLDVDIVATYAPVFHFHEHERMFPCGIEWLCETGTLKSHTDPGLSISSPTQLDLQAHCGADVYVEVDPARYRGQVDGAGEVTAPMYYAVRRSLDEIEINYVILYAFQDGQTLRALPVGNEFDCIVRTVGTHQGDLERVVVVLGAADLDVLRVGYESHGDVRYFTPDDVVWEGTHPVVNAALGGHGNHNLHVEGERIVEDEVPLIVAITANVSDSGMAWRPNVFELLGLDASGTPISDQVWAAFGGRLGVRQVNAIDSATHFDGSNLDGWEWAFVRSVGTIAEILKLLPPSAVDGNGARGPADRPWIRNA